MKKYKIILLILTLAFLLQPLGVVNAQCSQSQTVTAVEQDGGMWCWAACIHMADTYFLTSPYSQGKIVKTACENGLIPGSSGCWTCLLPGAANQCRDYGITSSGMTDHLVYLKYAHDARTTMTTSMLKTNICANGISIVGYYGAVNHMVLAIGYDENTYDYSFIDPGDGTYKTIPGTEVLNNPSWGAAGPAWYLSDCDRDNNPRARVTEFSSYSSGSGVSVEWNTNRELNSDYYQVHKLDRTTNKFYNISENIDAVGSEEFGSDYSFIDIDGSMDDMYRLVEFESSGHKLTLETSEVLNSKPEYKERKIVREQTALELLSDTKELLANSPFKKTQRILSSSSNYTWVAIYPAVFETEVADLVTWRNSTGQTAFGITYEDVVANYNTIDAYVENLWTTQGQVLDYVLLYGDGSTCQYHSYCTETTHDFIPVDEYTDGFQGDEYYSDKLIADVDGDGIADISVGRVPAYDSYTAAAYVNKVIQYETGRPEWATVENDISVFLLDKDASGNSGEYVKTLGQNLIEQLPGSFDAHKISMDELLPGPSFGLYADREAIAIADFDAGRSTVVGLGTSNNLTTFIYWLGMSTSLPSPFDVSKLQANKLPPFIIGASCHMGLVFEDQFDATQPSIVEELLLSPDRGAIGFFAPTSGTMQQANADISSMVLSYLYEVGVSSAGEACRLTQQNIIAEGAGYAETANAFIFLGDPAIKIRGSINDDQDGDGILSDGDNSGYIWDNPCTGGNTVDCDDNCITAYNPDQTDCNSNGIGDVCDSYYSFVGSTNPSANANVDPSNSSIITADFCSDMDATTFNNNTVKVSSSVSGAIAGTVMFLPTTNQMLFLLSETLSQGDIITVTLTSDIQSLSGDPLNNGYTWSFNTLSCAEGQFESPQQFTSTAKPADVVSADFNGDGYNDIAVASAVNDIISIHLNDGLGNFTLKSDITVGPNLSPSDGSAGDVDGDGDIDLAFSCWESGTILILDNNGNGVFSYGQEIPAPCINGGVQIIDIDADGHNDLLYTEKNCNKLSIAWGLHGVFSKYLQLDVQTYPQDPHAVDFNNDGNLDLVVVNGLSNTLSVFKSDGAGNFEPRVDYNTGNHPLDLAIADFNTDGFLDVSVSVESDNKVRVYFNNGQGLLLLANDYSTNAKPSQISPGDFNGDGNIDLVFSYTPSSDISILWNDGLGSFGTIQNFSIPATIVTDVYPADLDADGSVDFVTSNFYNNEISVIFNDGIADMPVLRSPLNGKNLTAPVNPHLDCYDITNGLAYQFQIDDNEDFSSPIASSGFLWTSEWDVPVALEAGTYYWHAKASTSCSNGDWSETWHIVVEEDIILPPPPKYEIANYPNPFNPMTTISYSLAANVHVTIDVINLMGQTIKTLVDQSQEAGQHSVMWDGKNGQGADVASGVYFYRIQSDDFNATKKMMLLK